jgi:hypothetical protein
MELALNTIVVTILAVIVLASVGLFFFSEAKALDKTADSAQCVQQCQTAKALVAVGGPIETAKESFCKGSCDKVMNCQIKEIQKISC